MYRCCGSRTILLKMSLSVKEFHCKRMKTNDEKYEKAQFPSNINYFNLAQQRMEENEGKKYNDNNRLFPFGISEK